VNFLWEKIESGLWGIYNNLYYVVEEKETFKEDGKEEQERITPLTVSHLADALKFSSRTVRKIITSLNIEPENKPSRFRVGGHMYRGIFFEPTRLEKRLQEFVVDYEERMLSTILGLPVTDVTDVTANSSGRTRGQTGKKETAPEVGTVTSVTSVTPLEALISELHRYSSFMNDTSFIYVAKVLGSLSDREAQSLWNMLVQEGKLARDPDGVWKWVT
jgi:hypothetical protein